MATLKKHIRKEDSDITLDIFELANTANEEAVEARRLLSDDCEDMPSEFDDAFFDERHAALMTFLETNETEGVAAVHPLIKVTAHCIVVLTENLLTLREMFEPRGPLVGFRDGVVEIAPPSECVWLPMELEVSDDNSTTELRLKFMKDTGAPPNVPDVHVRVNGKDADKHSEVLPYRGHFGELNLLLSEAVSADAIGVTSSLSGDEVIIDLTKEPGVA